MVTEVLLTIHAVTLIFGVVSFMACLTFNPEPSSRKLLKEAIELFLICTFILEILPIALCVVIFKFVKRLVNNT